MSRRASARLLILVAFAVVAGCTPNLALEGDKTYAPPPVTTITVEGFGINAEVDVLADGDLPLTFSRSVTNNGNGGAAAGYGTTDQIERLGLVAVVGGAASFQPIALPEVATCTEPGPALAQGASAPVDFTLQSASCTTGPALINPTQLECGMYRETLTIDSGEDVEESNEGDNSSQHFFFVPSQQPRINLNAVLNPNGSANQAIVPVRVIQITAFNVQVPGPGPVAELTHNVTARTVPPGGPYTIGYRQTAGPAGGSLVGTRITVAPPPPPPPAFPITARLVFAVTVNFDPTTVAPLSNRVDGLYEENFSVKFTMFSADGCQVRQETVQVKVIHEAA